MKLKLATFNTKGLRDFKKRRKVFTWLRDNKFSIIFLQETHVTKDTAEFWQNEWGYTTIFSGNNSQSAGVGILLRPDSPVKFISHTEIIVGRIQKVEAEINGQRYNLFNIYGPNDDDAVFFDILNNELTQIQEENVIIGGDLNVILDSKMDKEGGRGDRKPKQRQIIQKIMEDHELSDVWRVVNPDKKIFTWHSNSIPRVSCRLDYFIVSCNLMNLIRHTKIIPGFLSDHSLVCMKLETSIPDRGPGYWKLNTDLLLDLEYKNRIQEKIKEIVSLNESANANTKWELIKGTVRSESISYSAQKSKERKNVELQLQKEIEAISDCLNTSKNPSLENQLLDKQKQLELLYERKTNGIILRAKCRWVEEGEKNTRYFANLEKRNYENKVISELKVNGKSVSDPIKILEEEKLFYERLYTKKKTNHMVDDFFPKEENRLSNEEKESIEGELSETEIQRAVKNMKNKKSPGSDGIPVEFYKIFWSDIKKYLLESLNYSFKIGKLTQLQSQGIITLIPKKDRDRTLLSNWRPITLLNTDYKIAAKAVANRIKKVLSSVIHHSQTGFMQERYIGENIRLIHDVITFANDNKVKGLIMFIDFEKAFDSIDHEYMIKTLTHFNFGPDVLQWITLFYSNANSCVINNGYLSSSFNVKSGTRQGCPLSPYIFNIMIEVLSILIRKSDKVKGFRLYDNVVKFSAYADDVTMFLDGTETDVKVACETLEYFGSTSGLKVNYEKSAILRIGPLKNTTVQFCSEKKFTWTSESVKTLGIHFFNDETKTVETNISNRLKEMRSLLQRWKRRNLTLLGKITVIKMLALPIIVYTLTNLPDPSAYIIKIINKELFAFLWNNKPDRIARKVVVQNIENGGLKMIDIQCFISALKANWVKRYVHDENKGNWKTTFRHHLKAVGGNNFFNSRLTERDLRKYFPKENFVYQVLKHWGKVVQLRDASDNILEQAIWYNSCIKQGKDLIVSTKWIKKGILQLKHIIQEQKLTPFSELKEMYDLDAEDYFVYQQVKHSIPPSWLRRNESDVVVMEPLIIQVAKKTKCTKFFYEALVNGKITETIHSQEKWKNIIDVKDLEWKKVYKLAMSCTIDNRLKNFQYKLLHRIVSTNTFLLKIQKAPSSLCGFCLCNPETLEHLFWECQEIQSFWADIYIYMQNRIAGFSFNRKKVFFGDPNCSDAENIVILSAKKYIFNAKCHNYKIDLKGFRQILKDIETVERNISFKNDKTYYHLEKWSSLFPL